MATIENKTSIDTVPTQEVNEQSALPLKKQPPYLRWGIIGGVILIVFLGGLALFKRPTPSQQTLKQPPQAIQPTSSPSVQPTKPRSKAPGIVSSVVAAKSVDPKTGDAVNPTSVFLTTDKSIYIVTSLQNAKVGTKIEYVRYLSNKFLDNRSITITKPSTNNTSFVWTLRKPGATHPIGNYRVKVYTNGVFEKEIMYIIQ